MDYETLGDPVIVAQTAMDGHRLSTTGFVWENFELHILIAIHGYQAVLDKAAKITVYA